MKPVLRIFFRNYQKLLKQVMLDHDRMVIGRHPDCDIRIEESSTVGRRHAIFWAKDGEYSVEDFLSPRGTFLNGTMIQKRHVLKDGDVVKIEEMLVVYSAPPDGEKSCREF